MTHMMREPAGTLDELEVRHIHPYQAVKPYRCPGCDHEIPKGQGHEVVVPRDDPSARRHWHTGCWHQEARRRG
jgi:hypothetical protein